MHSDPQQKLKLGAVAIGRNEGDRVKRCLASLSQAAAVIYVDSGSTDGSARWAQNWGCDVIELDMSMPFTAARARNSGFHRLQKIAPQIDYVQFVDGDCELVGDWLYAALTFLESHPDIGAVCGRRRERFPEKSIYNWLCDLEWGRPVVGETRAFGGDVMMRANALESVGGYRDDVIAAEDDELCVRLRAAGWRLWRIDHEMALHDAAMTRFSQWWQRSLRCGYGFAQVSYLHGEPPERYFVWESRRAWLWGIWLPIACLVSSLTLWPWGAMAWLIYPLQILRQTARNSGLPNRRATIAFYQVLGRFPEGLGQLRFVRNRVLGRAAQIVEYK
jgi:cellulose synthase/poly-beta-1,6-N-acetylglucosamine synthase-like glycosyltransferase